VSEGLGSADEPCELTVTSHQEVVLEPDFGALPAVHLEVREKKSTKESPSKHTSDIKQMLAGIMAVVKQSNTNLQQSVQADLGSVKADISSKISQLLENIIKFQENLRTELKAENEKLIKRFEL
jgi:gas vesicle protein